MRTEETSFPSFTTVLLQQQSIYSSLPPEGPPPHLVFPWTPVTYNPPFIATPPPPTPSVPPPGQGPATPGLKFMIVVQRFFTALVDKIKARR
ncbi:hypothetical protein R3P38DRAFT_3165703 [Favolaschia claudopus]|uniref:Uncharacterized protein n=1 Tax=Favolaschia claudopus TaxID=2862362 RepID=A0AAW0EIW5_9AGAR